MTDQDFQLFISTAPDLATAKSLARGLVQKRLAACVNIIPQVISIYEWQASVEEAEELVLLIKSTSENFNTIETYLQANHPYEVPELISCNINEVSASYGQWLKSALD